VKLRKASVLLRPTRRCVSMEAQFWLNLQSRYDLLCAEAELDQRLEKEVTPHAAWE